MKARTIISGLIAALFLLPLVPAQAAEHQVRVMSRNLYLGADVGVALQKIPNLPAAAQFMWDQVRETDFAKRKVILVEQIKSESPDVIGIQEATIWYCKAHLWSSKTEVYNFTKDLLAELGGSYAIANKDGVEANNPGYSIGPIPFLTKVTDPKAFQPLFGQDSASCGFQIGDALLVKSELIPSINAVGNSEYDSIYKVVPTLMEIYRGYSWADISINNVNIRFVTTHLESLWDPNKVPKSADQARQLVKDLTSTKSPIVVIGDFNSDPRDPRPTSDSNPGEQPTASTACPAASMKCNPYKIMRNAGYVDSGPDASNPQNYTWGMNALLTGPDPKRAKAAKSLGNKYGFTDRLDYIFTKNNIRTTDAHLIGVSAPYGTDHAGLVVDLAVDNQPSITSAPLDAHHRFPISFWNGVGILLILAISLLILRKIRRR